MKSAFLLGLVIFLITPISRADDDPPELNAMHDLCGKFKDVITEALTVAHERKLAKISGALNAKEANDSARRMVEFAEAFNVAMAEYEKEYKTKFDEQRCIFIREMSTKQMDEALSVINPGALKKIKTTEKKAKE